MELSELRRVLVADDHALFRQGLGLVLKSIANEIRITEAASIDEVVGCLGQGETFELILLDLSMPGMDVGERLRDVCDKAAPAPVVILSAYQDRQAISAAIATGARGYMLKSFSEQTLRLALGLILVGEIYVPPSVLNSSTPLRPDPLVETGVDLEDSPLSSLSPRQLDVLKLVMQGQSNKHIARELGVLESTVKAHLQVVLRKLNAENRTHAAMIAREFIEHAATVHTTPSNAQT